MTIYNDGTYLKHNPTWGIEDSIWKASNILRLIERNNIEFASYTEVGCGAGRVIHELSTKYPTAVFHGYDISPQAIDLAKQQVRPI
jgi:trans-aconitate methyltransferase